MADTNHRECVCSVCGAKIRIRMPQNLSFAEGEEDLDFRPAGTARDAFRGWVHACPRCGHVARKPEDSPRVAERFLQTENYRDCDGISFADGKARQYYKFFLISREAGDLQDELLGIRGAVWACDDAGDHGNAAVCRRIGVDVLDQLLEQNEDEYYHMIRMDFLRRGEMRAQLEEQYAGVRFEDTQAERARRFQLSLAKAGDAGPHSMAELNAQELPAEEDPEDHTVLLDETMVTEDMQDKTIVAGKNVPRTAAQPQRKRSPEVQPRREHSAAAQPQREHLPATPATPAASRREHASAADVWERRIASDDRPRRSFSDGREHRPPYTGEETECLSWEEQEAILGGLRDLPPQPAGGAGGYGPSGGAGNNIGKSSGGESSKGSGKSGGKSKKAIIAVIIILVLLVGGFFLGKKLAVSVSEPEEPVAGEEIEGLTPVSTNGIRILSSDWDWDSREVDELNDRKQVYAILLVENESDSSITRIDLDVVDKYGDYVRDVDKPDSPLSAEGYIKAGQKGVMVMDVDLDRGASQKQPHKGDYDILAAYTNEDIEEDYEVPTGKITQHVGNTYDAELSNPNEDEVNQNALLVAVKIRDDRLKEADATGKLTNVIPGKTPVFLQQRAFDDPHMNTDIDDLVVYVIDRDYYNDAR